MVVFLVAASTAFAAARRPGLVLVVVRAILVAIGILLVASLVLLVVDTGAALQPAIVRFKGIEENPDTLPLLAAYALPLAAWRVRAGAGAERWLAATEILAVLLVLGASGSRGGLVAGTAGLLVYAWAELGTRLRTVAAGGAILVVCGATLAITPLLVHLPGARPYVRVVASRLLPSGADHAGRRHDIDDRHFRCDDDSGGIDAFRGHRLVFGG